MTNQRAFATETEDGEIYPNPAEPEPVHVQSAQENQYHCGNANSTDSSKGNVCKHDTDSACTECQAEPVHAQSTQRRCPRAPLFSTGGGAIKGRHWVLLGMSTFY